MHRRRLATTLVFAVLCLLAAAASAPAQQAELVGLLTSKLGVTTEQAQGGAGSIFGLAKQNLSAPEFSRVAAAVPGIDGLLKAAPAAAPKAGGSAGMLGSAASMLGKTSGTLGGLAGLASSFSTLGMGAGMVDQFVPIVLGYVQSKGGDSVMSLLQGALQ